MRTGVMEAGVISHTVLQRLRCGRRGKRSRHACRRSIAFAGSSVVVCLWRRPLRCLPLHSRPRRSGTTESVAQPKSLPAAPLGNHGRSGCRLLSALYLVGIRVQKKQRKQNVQRLEVHQRDRDPAPARPQKKRNPSCHQCQQCQQESYHQRCPEFQVEKKYQRNPQRQQQETRVLVWGRRHE
ncbi:hypothetical protein TcYC6_0001880 [Trypanosoma cruzi]|nr:hypothetical protein TcYC6_0001880 [Trypanosoma cruzi]